MKLENYPQKRREENWKEIIIDLKTVILHLIRYGWRKR